VPRKNARYVAGTSHIGRAVDTFSESRTVDRTIFSTDDPEIGNVTIDHGAGLTERPPELGGDETSSESALLHRLAAQ